MIDLLVQHGADVNANVGGGTALIVAAANGQLEGVKVLIEKGAKLNLAAKNGATPLIAAATNGHREIVSLLEQHGAQ